jgi:hypothetical protein
VNTLLQGDDDDDDDDDDDGILHEDCFSCVISGFRRDADEICPFWDITQRREAVLYRRCGTTHRPHLRGSGTPFFLDFLILEDGTHRLSRNVGTELPLYSA